MTRKTKRVSAFERIRAGLENAVAHAEGRKRLTVREVALPERPAPMTAAEIVALRSRVLGVSQNVFARVINASPQTVHAWEQGRARPSGPTLRFLRIIERKPEVVGELVKR